MLKHPSYFLFSCHLSLFFNLFKEIFTHTRLENKCLLLLDAAEFRFIPSCFTRSWLRKVIPRSEVASWVPFFWAKLFSHVNGGFFPPKF